jgi:Lon protease-like protein
LPLFPLSTVLYPQGPLPLRIFEPRYVDMVRRCMKTDTGFGVVLIVRGREAGGAAATAAIGTEARIVDFDQLEDGLLGLTCIGQQRIRVERAWQQPDGLNIGVVEDLPADPSVPVPSDCAELKAVIEKVWPELAGPYAHVPPHFDDAGWIANRLAELAPLDAGIRQSLLEASDPAERLRVLAPLIRVHED